MDDQDKDLEISKNRSDADDAPPEAFYRALQQALKQLERNPTGATQL